MPYRTIPVKAPLFLQHKGIKIYHTFKDDDADSNRLEYWYTLDPCAGDMHSGDGVSFDVRGLSTFKCPVGQLDSTSKEWIRSDIAKRKAIKQAIRDAIDKGELKPIADVA